MKDLIRHLIDNRYPFGMWPEPECYGKELGEAMQAKAAEIGSEYFKLLEVGGWKKISLSYAFSPYLTYRLRADYTEDEYETVNIYEEGADLHFMDGGEGVPISHAPTSKHFAGYLYEDGLLSGQAVTYNLGGSDIEEIYFKFVKSGEVKVLRPTHVVFKK